MPWFRLDDSFHSHPKVLQAGNEAIGLYVRCGTYAAQHLTDGFIPEHVVLLYGSKKLAAVLVEAKLWRRTRGGWKMPDYLEYNPSKEAVDKDRRGKAERQKRWRENRRRRVTNASSNASRNAPGDAAPTRPAPKDAGRVGNPSPGAGATGRAGPTGSPVRAVPDWCGKCDERTRQINPDAPKRCPVCHPLRDEETA
jgi:hypothetical protein